MFNAKILISVVPVRGDPWRTDKKTELKIDFRTHGIPQAAVEQEDERTSGIKRLVHEVKTHPNKGASIEDLQKTCTYNAFSEESKKVNHNLGNVEYFELCEKEASSTALVGLV